MVASRRMLLIIPPALETWVSAVWPVLLADAAVVAAMVWAARRWNSIPEAADPAKVERLRDARHVNEASLDVALDVTKDVLERGLKALDALDRKAAFIPPALGVAASIVIPRVFPEAFNQPIVVASGTSALVVGMTALIAAVAVLYPRFYKAGPDPLDTALHVGDPALAFKLAIENSLARSAVNVEKLVLRKADLWLVSVLSLGVTILLVAIFGVAGGFGSGSNGT